MKAKMILAVLIIALVPHPSSAQQDSLADVFPLAVGNRWTYHYDMFLIEAPIDLVTVDTGFVTIRIRSQWQAADSTTWLVEQTRNLIRRQGYYGEPWIITFPVQDSSTFELIERQEGQHQLYRNMPWYSNVADVIPFTRLHTDTTTILRYRRDDSTGNVTILSRPPFNLRPQSLFTFRQGIGNVRYQYVGGPFTGEVYRIDHQLVNSVITAVIVVQAEHIPDESLLHQNYPNPFSARGGSAFGGNPTTAIAYSLSSQSSDGDERNVETVWSYVTLKVYDILGREVTTLVHEKKPPGNYEVRFDAAGLPSGVYFYRLTSGPFTQTRKLLLLR
jgi:hypothetical protein